MRYVSGIMRIAVVGVLLLMGACADKSAPPSILESDANYIPFTPVQQKWALATCAVLTQSNGMKHDLLGGCEKTPENAKTWQEVLRVWWRINDKAGLLSYLNWIDGGGHRRQFDELGARLATLSEEELEAFKEKSIADVETSSKIRLVLEHHSKLGEKSIAGWDYARYVSFCGWGYIAGYLTEGEAWMLITPAARKMQQTFDSWEELGRNHVIGREFWSLKHTQARGGVTVAAYEMLLKDPSSPWVNIPWNLPLSPEPQPPESD